MKAKVSSAQYSTVSYLFIEDWLYALRLLCTEEKYLSFLKHADLTIEHNLSAVETGDEMIGLWKRPIRARALQHLLTSVCEATSLTSALYRFSTFWNLFLDEYQFTLNEKDNRLVLAFEAQDESTLQRFGHMLILKLAHGFISWLDRKEVPVSEVGFAFDSPNFADDYSVIFPSLVKFSCRQTFISFDLADLGPVQIRSTADLDLFLENAPRDWIFTRSREHTEALRVRSYLSRMGWESANLTEVARSMHLTSRTLIRRLEADGTSFQSIKDALRRDIAIRHLSIGLKSIEEIAHEVGFSSTANFHRAFQSWTGTTPSSYRNGK